VKILNRDFLGKKRNFTFLDDFKQLVDEKL